MSQHEILRKLHMHGNIIHRQVEFIQGMMNNYFQQACFICKNPEHWAQACPFRRQKQENKSTMTSPLITEVPTVEVPTVEEPSSSMITEPPSLLDMLDEFDDDDFELQQQQQPLLPLPVEEINTLKRKTTTTTTSATDENSPPKVIKKRGRPAGKTTKLLRSSSM